MPVNHSDVLVTFQDELLGGCKAEKARSNDNDIAVRVHNLFYKRISW